MNQDDQDEFEQTLDQDTVDSDDLLDNASTLPCLVILQGKDRGKRIQVEPGELTMGRSQDATVLIQDNRISRVHCRVIYRDEQFWVEDCDSRNGTHVNGKQVEARTQLKPGALIRIGHTLIRLSFRHAAEVALEEEPFHAATTDPLTGIFNRRWFEEQGEFCITRARRHGSPLSILILDVDYFKRINDAYGHACGDSVLVSLTKLLCSIKRHEDLLCRHGGEEFLLMMVETDLRGASLLAERLRKKVNEHSFQAGEEVLSITVSIGVSSFRSEDTYATLLERADRALYRAKGNGRNRVEVQELKDECDMGVS